MAEQRYAAQTQDVQALQDRLSQAQQALQRATFEENALDEEKAQLSSQLTQSRREEQQLRQRLEQSENRGREAETTMSRLAAKLRAKGSAMEMLAGGSASLQQTVRAVADSLRAFDFFDGDVASAVRTLSQRYAQLTQTQALDSPSPSQSTQNGREATEEEKDSASSSSESLVDAEVAAALAVLRSRRQRRKCLSCVDDVTWLKVCKASTIRMTMSSSEEAEAEALVIESAAEGAQAECFRHALPTHESAAFESSDEKLWCRWRCARDSVQQQNDFWVMVYFKDKHEYDAFVGAFQRVLG